MDANMGMWMLLCVTARVDSVWETLARSVDDNRSWVGHWLSYATSELGLARRRRTQSKAFPSELRDEIMERLKIECGDLTLEETLQSVDAAGSFFSHCKRVKVLGGYLSELEHTNEQLLSWDAVICIKPEVRSISDNNNSLFELRCMVSSKPSGARNFRTLYVRHSGKNFWVQRGNASPSRCSGSLLLDERAWEDARLAVFTPRVRSQVESVKRRYMNLLGGQSHVYCGIHACPLVLNHSSRGSDSMQRCIWRTIEHTSDGSSKCKKDGDYICPHFDECHTACCRHHVKEAKEERLESHMDVLFLSVLHGTSIERIAGGDDGGIIVNPEFDSETVPIEALGPMVAHEIPQDVVDDHTDKNDLNFGSIGCSDDETVSLDWEQEFHDNDEYTGDHRILDTELGVSITEEKTRGRGFLDVGDNTGMFVGEETHEKDNHFGSQGIPTTTLGTSQPDVEIVNYSDSEHLLPLCVLFNQLGHLLTRTGYKIRMNKRHKHACQRLVATNTSQVVPLVYAEAQLFADIFWQTLPDGTIPGAMPVALWTDKQTLKHLGVASLKEHANQRLSNPALLTSVDPRYHFMLLDQLSNLGARGRHTRVILQRGFADHQGKDGVVFKNSSDSAEVFGETCENHANVHKLAELVREKQPHYFFTQTCNHTTCRGLRILREWVESKEAMVLLHNKYGLEFDEASRFIRESAAIYASRSWNEVVDMWFRYIMYSVEEPLGPIRYGWLRKEFQGKHVSIRV